MPSPWYLVGTCVLDEEALGLAFGAPNFSSSWVNVWYAFSKTWDTSEFEVCSVDRCKNIPTLLATSAMEFVPKGPLKACALRLHRVVRMQWGKDSLDDVANGYVGALESMCI